MRYSHSLWSDGGLPAGEGRPLASASAGHSSIACGSTLGHFGARVGRRLPLIVRRVNKMADLSWLSAAAAADAGNPASHA